MQGQPLATPARVVKSVDGVLFFHYPASRYWRLWAGARTERGEGVFTHLPTPFLITMHSAAGFDLWLKQTSGGTLITIRNAAGFNLGWKGRASPTSLPLPPSNRCPKGG